MDTQTTTQPLGSRLLFSRYKGRNAKGETDQWWSLRWRPSGNGKPVTLCSSSKNSPEAVHDVMEELFDDPVVEARLTDIMRRHGEP